jgi:hypothetical protein
MVGDIGAPESRPAAMTPAAVTVRWIDPLTGIERVADGRVERISGDGIVLIVGVDPGDLPGRRRIVRLLLETSEGPFVIHAQVAEHRGQLLVIQPVTEARFHDRRRGVRIPDPPIAAELTGDRPAAIQIVDISKRGVRFVSPQAIEPESRLPIVLHLDGDTVVRVVAVVIAAWRDDDDSGWRCRCRFESVDDEEALSAFVDAQPIQTRRAAKIEMDHLTATAVRFSGEQFSVQVDDLSLSGIRFETDQPVIAGDHIELHIRVNEGEPIVVSVTVNEVTNGAIPGRIVCKGALDAVPERARRTILASTIRFLVVDRAA